MSTHSAQSVKSELDYNTIRNNIDNEIKLNRDIENGIYKKDETFLYKHRKVFSIISFMLWIILIIILFTCINYNKIDEKNLRQEYKEYFCNYSISQNILTCNINNIYFIDYPTNIEYINIYSIQQINIGVCYYQIYRSNEYNVKPYETCKRSSIYVIITGTVICFWLLILFLNWYVYNNMICFHINKIQNIK